FARRGEEVRILYGDKKVGLLRLPPNTGAATHSDYQAWFVRLPSGAHYVMTAHPASGDGVVRDAAPTVLHVSRARYPLDVWQEPETNACVDVQLAVDDPDVTVFIDGFPISFPHPAKSTRRAVPGEKRGKDYYTV